MTSADGLDITRSNKHGLDGYCVSNAAQRQGIIDFLDQVEKTMGWRVLWTIEKLQRQWKELDELEKGIATVE